MLRGHHVVGAAVRLARDHRQLWHRGLGERVQQLGPVADDPAPLLARPGQEAGHVHEREQGDVERVARAHEARRLGGGVDVEHSRQLRRLVAHDPD